jgi:hypothetical protein
VSPAPSPRIDPILGEILETDVAICAAITRSESDKDEQLVSSRQGCVFAAG